MLKTLNSVRWNKLEHAYGKANDVPQLIRDLTSSSATVREQALWALYGNLWHQGTVFEATAYAVPFLIELLELSNCSPTSFLLFKRRRLTYQCG
ncbi:hypothetical protein ACKFKF_20625 [Phormidesmis sp. 146-12]